MEPESPSPYCVSVKRLYLKNGWTDFNETYKLGRCSCWKTNKNMKTLNIKPETDVIKPFYEKIFKCY